MNYDLITVGRVNMDLDAQDIGSEFAEVTGFDAAVGGSPSNVALGTSRLGLRTVAFTAVGEDTVGDLVLRYLNDAGDSFASGMISSRIKGEDWYHSCRVRNACGAITGAKHGCAVAVPTPEEPSNFVESHGGL